MLFSAPLLLGATSTAPSAEAEKVDSLIQRLADPDPAAREAAATLLKSLGMTARPQLMQAARSPSPQIASGATELLMQLPWSVESDPPEVRKELAEYGNGDNAQRKNVIAKIFKIPGGTSALLRLAQDDPSDSVSWFAASALSLLEDADITAQLCAMDLREVRVQMLILAGRALLQNDRQKAMEVLRRAIEASAGGDEVQMTCACTLLVTDALEQGDAARAASFLRLRARNASSDPGSSPAVFELFALYADHGLTSEAAKDFEEFSVYLGRPEILYAISRIERTKAGGSNMLADVFSRAALAGSLESVDVRAEVAKICSNRAWNDEARQELRAIVQTKTPVDDPAENYAFYARAELTLLAALREDYASATEYISAQMRAFEKSDRFSAGTDLQAQRNGYLLHAARDAHDVHLAADLLNKLVDLPAPDCDVAIEVVNALRAEGRNAEARAYFARAYGALKAEMQDRSQLSTWLNNTAWLCAKCNEKPQEAIELAKRAMALEPDSYGAIDTAATAYFAAGNVAEAIRLEKRALLMRPNDVFLQRQMEKFQQSK